MGMDMYHFRVKDIIDVNKLTLEAKEELLYNNKVGSLVITPRVTDWMKQAGFSVDYAVNEPILDETATIPDNLKDWEITNWDLTHTAMSDNWIELTHPVTEELVTLKGEQLIFKDQPTIYFHRQEVGYMRKPFRHSETPTIQEGDTMVFSVTNFSDNGLGAMTVMREYDNEQAESGNVEMFSVQDVQKLAEFSYSVEDFSNNFIKEWQPQDYVLINW